MSLDLREFAGQILDMAKENLRNDGCLLPVAFVVTGEQVLAAPIVFQTQEEKEDAYRLLVESARAHQALAIVTLNDAHYRSDPGGQTRAVYYPGKLAAEGAAECILLTISGPGIASWEVRIPYQRGTEGLAFGETEESNDIQLNLLGDWASRPSRPS